MSLRTSSIRTIDKHNDKTIASHSVEQEVRASMVSPVNSLVIGGPYYFVSGPNLWDPSLKFGPLQNISRKKHVIDPAIQTSIRSTQ
jgi:hypothetical protein